MKHFYIALMIFIHFSCFAQTPVTASFAIDYGQVDKIKATQISSTFAEYPAFLNTRWGYGDSLKFRDAITLYDSIVFADYPNLRVIVYPLKATTLTLDSFAIYFRHSNVTQNNDSIRISVCNRDSIVVTGSGANQHLITPDVMWDTLIVANSPIVKNVLINNVPVYTKMIFYPYVSLAKGKTFGIRVDFTGDTANHFEYYATYRNDCNNSCLASRATIANNSLYLSSYAYTVPGNYAFNIHSDCDANGTIEAATCEADFWIQNWSVTPYVTVEADTFIEYSFITSILEETNDAVEIYPNPSVAGSQLTVASELVGGNLEVYDANGRIVFQSAIRSPQSEISLPFPAGVYFVRVQSERGSVVKKLIRL